MGALRARLGLSRNVGRLILLSARYGAGHLLAAKALKQAFEHFGARVELYDLILGGGFPERLAEGFYNFTQRRAHWLWAALYYNPLSGSALGRWFLTQVHRRALNYLKREKPPVAVSTHFTASDLAWRAGAKVFTVITDFVLHPLWLGPYERFFVAWEGLAEELRALGHQAEATGIPLRRGFWELPEKEKAREKLGIPKGEPVVLLMGGAGGVTDLTGIAARLKGVFVIAVAGRNEKLRARFEAVVKKGLVFGFTEEVPLLLAAADATVSKGGGIYTSEALATGTPIVFFGSMPGQERGNERVVVSQGAGLSARSPEEAAEKLLEILENSQLRERMEAAARRLGKPRAALEIAQRVLSLLP